MLNIEPISLVHGIGDQCSGRAYPGTYLQEANHRDRAIRAVFQLSTAYRNRGYGLRPYEIPWQGILFDGHAVWNAQGTA